MTDTTNSDVIVTLTGIAKSYRGARAVRTIDFTLHAGEIHALLGENGAGKSALMKIIAVTVQADSGRMTYQGQECRFRSPAEALSAGIAMVFQETSLCPP